MLILENNIAGLKNDVADMIRAWYENLDKLKWQLCRVRDTHVTLD